jgi:hypothetical protein
LSDKLTSPEAMRLTIAARREQAKALIANGTATRRTMAR